MLKSFSALIESSPSAEKGHKLSTEERDFIAVQCIKATEDKWMDKKLIKKESVGAPTFVEPEEEQKEE